jgi:hypothetical protein
MRAQASERQNGRAARNELPLMRSIARSLPAHEPRVGLRASRFGLCRRNTVQLCACRSVAGTPPGFSLTRDGGFRGDMPSMREFIRQPPPPAITPLFEPYCAQADVETTSHLGATSPAGR